MQGLSVAVDSYAPSDLSPSGDVWDALKAFSQAWTDGLKVVNGERQRAAAAAVGRQRAVPRRRPEGRRRGPAGDRGLAGREDPVTRRLVILGTSVTVPDPASVTDLAAGFRAAGRAAGRPRGDAAGAEQARRVGRVDRPGRRHVRPVHRPAARRGRGGTRRLRRRRVGAAAVRRPARAGGQRPDLPVLPGRRRRGHAAAVSTACAQAKARGQDTTTTGWDARLADANAAVSSLRAQLNRLLAELTALAATCAKQITAAEPKKPRQSLFG